nr:hypothetical protein [uncultured Flavobacterium sp.]
MKKLLLFSVFTFSLIACNNDDQNEEKEPNLPEVPETIMKLKMEDNRYKTYYYYNDLGFVDSLAMISDYGGNEYNYFKKFNYENGQIETIINYQNSAYNETENNIPKYIGKEEYIYNGNVIEKEISYGASDQIIKTNTFTYEENIVVLQASGYKIEKTFLNDNVIESKVFENEVEKAKTTYTYDTRYAPKYYIYPEAYKKIKSISRNNVKRSEYRSEGHNQTEKFILNYNSNHFLTYSANEEIYNGMVGISADFYRY